jgi:phosphoribosylanthranilate isomerase
VKLEVKICGITTPEALEAAAAAGADAIGLVFADSPRRVDIQQARQVTHQAPPGLAIVAVFCHPHPDTVARVLDELPIAWVQSDAQDHEVIAPLLARAGTPFRPVYRDGPDLRQRIDRGTQRGLNSGPILVEGPRSGSGIIPDWQRIAALHDDPPAPPPLRVVLAGGLSPANIAAAIREVRPVGVDTSSGVESAPGVKDPALIRAFIVAARASVQQHTEIP